MTWNEFPSLNYIFKGIIFEAKLALQQKLGCQASTDWVVKGQKNIEEAWESILELVEDRDLPISRDQLTSPTFPQTIVILHLYTIESFLYGTVNKSCRFEDYSKVETLGAYAQALATII